MNKNQFSNVSQLPHDVDAKNTYKVSESNSKNYRLRYRGFITFFAGSLLAAFIFSSDNGYIFLLESWKYIAEFIFNVTK